MTRKARISFIALICVLVYSLPAPADIKETASSFDRDNTTQFDPARQTISGRKVLVRVYRYRQADPHAYDKITLILTDLSISFDAVKGALPNLDESTVIVLAGEDQPDDVMARTIGNNVYAEPYE